jgi:8-oxo-dGTP pyrophosphatase MutT (NUDIX family)
MSPRPGVVQAAGGVVLGHSPEGGVTVLVVHRPRYDDWSLPKGKLEAGETHEDAAVREVEEETGFRCRLGRELRPLQYVDRHGREKVVRYWQMTVIEATGWEPNDEVDEVRWISAGDVGDLLTYHDDRHLVADVLLGDADLNPDGAPR